MSSLLASRAARRRSIVFTAFLATTLLMMAVSSSPIIKEFQGVASFVAAVSDIDRLNTDNTALRRDNERLTAENLRLQEQERENELLTGLLQLKNSLSYKTAAAEVIARDSSEFRRVVTISKGTDAGIEEGDVVVAEGGALAGRVIEVGGNFAKVVLISDQSSTVIGQLTKTGETGEVVGQLE